MTATLPPPETVVPTRARFDPSARLALRSAELRLRRELFTPPPVLTLSEWSDQYRHLSSVASAEPGKWRTARAPFQREIMDAISDTTYEEVVACIAVQSGKTEICILNPIGYYMDQDPAPILVVQPSLEPMAKAFSKDRLAPMIANSPVLRGKVIASNRRNSDDTLLHKSFPGGHVTIAGSNSAASLASRPIRVVLLDEIDRYALSAGNEGDPIELATKRTSTFWNRKIVKVSSPTITGASRIWSAFESGDMRFYFVPCPFCQGEQKLEWKGLIFEPLGYRCVHCNALIDETEKPKMLARGHWVATHPGRRVASFHLSALYSPWVTWETLRQEFIDAGRMPEKLQVFINTRLAECFNIDGEIAADASALSKRRVEMTAQVPDGVGLLTAGVDVQGDRLEFLLIGWGEGQQAWLLKHERIYGDPEQQTVWDDLDLLLTAVRALPSGAPLKIRCAAVDSGAFTNAVYRFVRTRQRRGVFATKGMSTRGKALINRPGRANKQGVRVVPLGTETGKDVLFARLKQTAIGPGFIHVTNGVTDEFLDQFGSETRRIRHERGVPFVEYHLRAGMRNEAIDLFVLNLAALHLLGAGVYDNLKSFVERARALPAPTPSAPPPEDPEPPIVLPQPAHPIMPRRSGYVGRW